MFEILIYVIFTVIMVFIAIWLSYEYYEQKTKVSVFPSMPGVRNAIVSILQKDISIKELKAPYSVLDLGSGSGQLTWEIARSFPDVQVVGIELSYIPWLRSVLRQKIFGPANLLYLREDFWNYDTSKFQAIVTYLPGRIMEKVGEKLRQELQVGTIVVANTFPLKAGWTPLAIEELHAPFKTNLYIYKKD